eukprot:352299_1
MGICSCCDKNDTQYMFNDDAQLEVLMGQKYISYTFEDEEEIQNISSLKSSDYGRWDGPNFTNTSFGEYKAPDINECKPVCWNPIYEQKILNTRDRRKISCNSYINLQTDNSKEISNKLDQFVFLMKMDFDGIKWSGSCSQIFIKENTGKTYFLTCAHNLYDYKNKIKSYKQWVVIDNVNVEVSNAYVYPKYFDSGSPYSGTDLAIIVINRKIKYKDRSLQLLLIENKNNVPYHGSKQYPGAVYGFPGDKYPELYGTSGTIKFDCTRNYGTRHDLIEYWDIDTFKGQSGSPIYLQVSSDMISAQNSKTGNCTVIGYSSAMKIFAVVGVHTGGEYKKPLEVAKDEHGNDKYYDGEKVYRGLFNYGTRLTRKKIDWITRYVPNVSCGILTTSELDKLQFGDPMKRFHNF